ncbi:lytic murein transglycosylase [Methylocella sp.]|uniref:lytic murein transglycosylase n=1 Tax=Methylocella sp. TaxID=1978226 RepID=UPI00378403C8
MTRKIRDERVRAARRGVRLAVAGAGLFALGAFAAGPAAAQAARQEQAQGQGQSARTAQFQAFLRALEPRARAAGVSKATFEAALDGLTPDPAAPSASAKQPEFDKPLKTYLAEAAGAARVRRGRAAAERWRGELARVAGRTGVPPAIILAAWGLETDFGAVRGGKDVVRTLATLAFERPDRPLFVDEWIAALAILEKEHAPREKLKGSWAGAMGDPQFIPSAYLKYAVSYDGQGYPDIWDKPQDSLASIGNFLRQSGWRPGQPWGLEVVLPPGFETPALRQTFEAFAAKGVTAADGTPIRARGEATLFLPSGARGPAFLLSENYWILKAYNNSDSYALSLGLLADRIDGAGALRGRWPDDEVFLSRPQKAAIQTALQKRGFYKGTVDGRFGQASRDAIHAYQTANAIRPADGFATPALLRRLTGD